MTDVYRCWRCGATASPQAAFCSSCGQSLAATPSPQPVPLSVQASFPPSVSPAQPMAPFSPFPADAVPPSQTQPATQAQGVFGPPLSPGGPPSMFGAAPPSFGIRPAAAPAPAGYAAPAAAGYAPPAPAGYAAQSAPYGAPIPAPYSAPTFAGPASGSWPAPVSAAASGQLAVAAKPFGIVVLAIAMVATAVVGLFVAWDYAYWCNWRLNYDEFAWAVVDGAFAVSYVATSVYAFTVAPKLWAINPWSWRTANQITAAWSGLNFLGIVIWGASALSLVGLVVMLGMLVYLNLTTTRAMFGRGPLVTFGQAA